MSFNDNHAHLGDICCTCVAYSMAKPTATAATDMPTRAFLFCPCCCPSVASPAASAVAGSDTAPPLWRRLLPDPVNTPHHDEDVSVVGAATIDASVDSPPEATATTTLEQRGIRPKRNEPVCVRDSDSIEHVRSRYWCTIRAPSLLRLVVFGRGGESNTGTESPVSSSPSADADSSRSSDRSESVSALLYGRRAIRRSASNGCTEGFCCSNCSKVSALRSEYSKSAPVELMPDSRSNRAVVALLSVPGIA